MTRTPETLVVNMHTSAWDVAIDRTSIFGNPFKGMGKVDAIASYRVYFLGRVEADPLFRAAVLGLRGKRLGCHCAPAPCHGAVIAEWLMSHDERDTQTKIKIDLSDPVDRATYEAALDAKREVESWPAWKRGERGEK